MAIILVSGIKSRLGLQAILEIEKIPYRHYRKPLTKLTSVNECITVTQPSLFRDSCLIFGETSSKLSESFGVKKSDVTHSRFLNISLNENIKIPTLTKFGFSKVAVPIEKIVTIDDSSNVDVLATCTIDKRQEEALPAIISKGNKVWCLFDLGLAFYNLLTEEYWETKNTQKKSFLAYSIFRKVYYEFLPSIFRRRVQRRHFNDLKRWMNHVESFKTIYPIDPTGFFIVQLFRRLLLRANGVIVSLSKWPYPYKSAAILTHDVEPTGFSYKKGLKRLVERLEELHIKPIINLVADSAERHLSPDFFNRFPYNIGSHGMYHDARLHLITDVEELRSRLERSRVILESLTKRKIRGFRAPRLQRTPALIQLIEDVGFQYDFSFIDVDREGTAKYGAGISMNYPFHPFLFNGDKPYKAKFLELPTSAPDCVAPIFMGYTEEECLGMFESKIDWIHDTEGLFVGNVHAGVFNEEDVELRTRLLSSLIQQIRQKEGMWLTSVDKIYGWWERREKICLSFNERAVTVCNSSNCEAKDLVLRISTPGGTKEISLSLEALEEVEVQY